MLTLHVPATGDALAVSGDRLAALGPAALLRAEHPTARVREWDGTVGAGRCAAEAVAVLEHAYHPDPREADTLGTAPLTGTALAALDLTATRCGHSARRGVQRLLADGVTALVGPFTRPEVRTAVRRSGLVVLTAPRDPELVTGGRADFTVTGADGRCLATVVAGRLLYRAR
ncbi:hypothetical protein QNO07_18160 [Streptomyces sp. 549]|uniref:hypothetical protein n=1 Tax=Streptomyces sp. 549 TaxID=3049076 RepID=UPI0024C28CC0|nr:hypothetical protein [Streptomyces sp. 549]MDK1475319.1 hypothetical protein [Streptomyces sp. 549]